MTWSDIVGGIALFFLLGVIFLAGPVIEALLQ